jgi:hypothetical protein
MSEHRCRHCSDLIIVNQTPNPGEDWESFFKRLGVIAETINGGQILLTFCREECLWSYRVMNRTHLRLAGIVTR